MVSLAQYYKEMVRQAEYHARHPRLYFEADGLCVDAIGLDQAMRGAVEDLHRRAVEVWFREWLANWRLES